MTSILERFKPCVKHRECAECTGAYFGKRYVFLESKIREMVYRDESSNSSKSIGGGLCSENTDGGRREVPGKKDRRHRGRDRVGSPPA
jgi:hypothetical protein